MINNEIDFGSYRAVGVPFLGLNTEAGPAAVNNLSPVLTPVHAIAGRLTAVPGEFTRREQLYVLRAHGLKTEQIGTELGIASDTVRNHMKAATAGFRSPIEVIMLLRSRKVTPLLIKGLNPNLVSVYRLWI